MPQPRLRAWPAGRQGLGALGDGVGANRTATGTEAIYCKYAASLCAPRPEWNGAIVGNIDDDETALIAEWIKPAPHSASADAARIAGTGVPVWALIGYLPAVHHDECQVAQDYELPVDAVRAAVAYYRRNREVIDAKLILNASSVV